MTEIPEIKRWLVSVTDSPAVANFPVRTDIIELAEKPEEPPFWETLRCLCPEEKRTFKQSLQLVRLVRDYRTELLCLTPGRGIGITAAAMRREITGCAGAGKSVLLCFNAWQIANKKAVSGNKLVGELSDTYKNFKQVHLLAPEAEQVQVLKEIMATIRGNGLFTSDTGSKDIVFMTVGEFLNSTPEGNFAVFLDEAQDVEGDDFNKLSELCEENRLLCYAYDRLQKLKDGKISQKNGTDFIRLSIQYRQPVPLYLGFFPDFNG